MLEKSDAQLLHDYAQHGVENAFSELVARHTNLVYSAALRQVDSPDLAAEIAQRIFVSLARDAKSLSHKFAENASLAGWLCRSAQNISLNFRRDEFRRRSRERQAMEQFDPNPENATDWQSLRAVLDDAMSELSEPDYDAIVMRFFESRDFRALGETLGVSDDTAQKRVSRALEKLRENLSRRGVRASAAGLSMALAANAIQAAPVGLAATISAAALAGTTATTVAAATITKAIIMTTLQKSLITAAFLAVAGTGIYEAREASLAREHSREFQQQQKSLSAQIRELERERDDATNRIALLTDALVKAKENDAELLNLRGKLTQLKAEQQKDIETPANSSNDPAEAAAKSWAARVTQLRQYSQQHPESITPEFRLLTENDWLNAAKDNLMTEKDFRQAFASLRGAAQNKLAQILQPALSKYVKENNWQFPTDLSQLQSYFKDGPVDESLLQRYAILPASTVPNYKMGGDWIITVKSPIDEEYDSRIVIGPNGYGSAQFKQDKPIDESAIATLNPLLEAFKDANGGRDPVNPAQLQPYATTEEQKAALQMVLQYRATNAAAR